MCTRKNKSTSQLNNKNNSEWFEQYTICVVYDNNDCALSAVEGVCKRIWKTMNFFFFYKEQSTVLCEPMKAVISQLLTVCYHKFSMNVHYSEAKFCGWLTGYRNGGTRLDATRMEFTNSKNFSADKTTKITRADALKSSHGWYSGAVTVLTTKD